MTTVFIVYGSRHGGTEGIAERIGEVIRMHGIEAIVIPADRVPALDAVDAVVVGSGVYMGRWLDEPVRFIEHHLAELASRPRWLFSSGPLSRPAMQKDADMLTAALGPEDGPGSGGRKKIAELTAATHARDHAIFLGRFDPDDPPRAISERFVRLMPVAKGALPPGDFRDWDHVEAWAHEIAASLAKAPAPAAT